MVRTINRQPYTVKQLDYGDVKYKFFNHSNWKGVCDDKNYLGVDQETFADSKNVYVDSEGILKSRPSVKQYVMTQSGLQYIYDLWTFGQWTVYQTSVTSLVFVKGDKVSQTLTVNQDFRLILVDEKIFVFEPNNLWYVDLTAETISKIDGKDKIYTPITSVVVKGVATDNESPNALTSSYITRYLYEHGESMLNIKGQTGTVKIGDITYTITFADTTQLILVKDIRVLTEKNYINGEPLVFTNSEAGYVLIGEWNNTGYSLYYSNDNIIYNTVPDLADQLPLEYTLLPAISQSKDHVYVVLYKDDGPYAYTIYYTTNIGIVPFNTWTNLTTYFSFDSSKVDFIKYINSPSAGSLGTKVIGSPGYFLDEKTYSFVMMGKKKVGLLNYKVIECFCISANSNKNISYRDGFGVYSTSAHQNPYSIFNVFINTKYAVLFANYSETGFTLSNLIRLRDFTEISGLPSLFKYQLNNNLSKSGGTRLTRGQQIKFNSIEGFIAIDILLPKNYNTDASSVNEECHIHRIGFNYDEALYNSDTVNYSSIVFDKFINIADDMLVEVSHNEDNKWTDQETSHTYYIPILKSINYIIASNANSILTYKYLIYFETPIPLLFTGIPAGIGNGFYIVNNNTLYTSNFNDAIQVDVLTEGELTFGVFDHETELSQFFVSKGKNLYINAQGANVGVDDFQWYFPERNVQKFDYEITNLHPISITEIAVFLQDSIYYIKPVTTTIDGIETIAYSYYKSRIPLGCEEGSEVITSYDNKYTMFATKRGFVAMSYQDFIASDEQALTFLSDTIYDMFNEWNQGAIKLFQYNFWIILYRTNTGKAFIFDMRSNSWWPIEYNSNVKKFIEIDRKPLLLSGLYLYKLDSSNDNYFDGNSLKDGRIDWFLSSQKLHLDAINYYKHIVNLTFFGYNYGDKDVNVRFNLRVINYRKQTDTNETKSFSAVDYKIQLTRTFVTRINYYKVNQVQYILESSRDEDAEDKIPVPLSLTAISLKYLVTGQVR